MDCPLEVSLARVDAFIAEHPEYSRKDVPACGQGSTNHVVRARRRDEDVIFKLFCEHERKERESYGLRHWRQTGLIAELLWDDASDMVVMSYVPGIWLVQSREQEGIDAWRAATRETGSAIARLTTIPLSASERSDFQSRFYAKHSFEDYVRQIVRLGRSVQARDPDFRDVYWKQNLDFIEGQIGRMLKEPSVLYHQDCANFHVQGGRFMGFFDVEMCRVGCRSMQLGSALGLTQVGDGSWDLFRQGWESVAGKLTPDDLACAAAGSHLLGWRVITRYLTYDGTPGTGASWASPANPHDTRKWIDGVNAMLGI
jgi:hypothetical protein